MQSYWCHTCGRKFQFLRAERLGCVFCKSKLSSSPDSPIVAKKRIEVETYVDGLSTSIAKELGFTPYFCLKIFTTFSKHLFPNISGISDYQKEQDLFDFLCADEEDNLETFINNLNRVLEYKLDAYFYRRMIGPDVYCIVDSAGKRINYKWESFEADLKKMWPHMEELKAYTDWDELLNYLATLYAKIDSDKFFEIVYTVHDSARQKDFWELRSGRSIVTVGSKLGRRPPEWGWD